MRYYSISVATFNSRARERIVSSNLRRVSRSRGMLIHSPRVFFFSRNIATCTPSEVNARPVIIISIFNLSFGVSGEEYQSVIIVPPKGSVDFLERKETVSKEAFHR